MFTGCRAQTCVLRHVVLQAAWLEPFGVASARPVRAPMSICMGGVHVRCRRTRAFVRTGTIAGAGNVLAPNRRDTEPPTPRAARLQLPRKVQRTAYRSLTPSRAFAFSVSAVLQLHPYTLCPYTLSQRLEVGSVSGSLRGAIEAYTDDHNHGFQGDRREDSAAGSAGERSVLAGHAGVMPSSFHTSCCSGCVVITAMAPVRSTRRSVHGVVGASHPQLACGAHHNGAAPRRTSGFACPLPAMSQNSHILLWKQHAGCSTPRAWCPPCATFKKTAPHSPGLLLSS